MSIPVNFLVDHVGASHMSFQLIEQANLLSEQGSADVIVFYDQLHRPCRRLLVPTMLMIEAWAQPGVTIATSVATASRALKFPGPSRLLFYVWDMSWARNVPKPVGPYTDLFRNPNLEIIARCQDHANILENNFNVSVDWVFDNFDHDELMKAVKNDRKTE